MIGRIPPRGAAAVLILVATLFTVAGYLHLTQPARYSRPQFPLSSIPDFSCNAGDAFSSHDGDAQRAIPNIVHYVWLLKNPGELSLDFKVFLSVYSAHIFWRPDRILIHTDASPDVWDEAQKSGSLWTRRVLAIPGVAPSHTEAPSRTTKGVAIKHMEHKADFLRIAALRDHGGVYLDVDAVPLRDVAELRKSGFANVVGGAIALSMKHSGYINNGVMMSIAQSNLMKIYYRAAHEFFTGEWSTAGVHLLTDLANRLLALPQEVLILQPQAFAPVSWEVQDQRNLFAPVLESLDWNERSASAAQPQETCDDVMAWLKQEEDKRSPSQIDFSSTYILHAFDDEIHKIRGWNHEIDAKYVMDRRSNYARAVFPAVRHAVEAGIIPREEIA